MRLVATHGKAGEMIVEPKVKTPRGARHLGPREPRKDKLTAKPMLVSEADWELYRAIVDFKINHDGCAPQSRELMALAHMGSTSVVAYHLLRLVRAGLIE